MNNASSYEEQKRAEEELEQLRIAAESGDKKAMCEYGKELAYNDKYSDAFKWLKKSEDLNDTDALKALGKCYLHRKGTDENIKKAINCFLRVVELGDSIGAYYINNISLEYDECIDFYEVVRIYEQLNNNLSTKKADANSISCYSSLSFMLACCYYWGVGTEQNKEHAKQLLLSVGYDFDKDNAPLLIKEITLAEPFPNIKPICKEFFIPLQKNFFWIDTKKLFDKRYSFLSKFNLSKYSKTKELFDFLQKDGVDPWLYLHTAKEKPANEMFDALVDNNYPAFRDACINEPYFAGSILLFNQLKTKYQHSNKLKSLLPINSNLVLFLDELSTSKSLSIHEKLFRLFLCGGLWLLLFFKTDYSIHSINLSKTQFIFACILIQSIIKESNIASNLTDSEDKKYKELTKLLNNPKFSDEIYEFKDYCRNTPSIFEGFEFTKEELSSIFEIVDLRKDESPVDIDETINFKDSIIPETYKCEIFDGCEKVYEKFFEKLKSVHYIDYSTSFESFKIAIGLVPKPEEGFFKRVIWKSMYGNRANWKPLLNMLRLIGIKREDLKPKTLNSLFVHSTGKRIDSNVIKVHKATALIEFNGKKQSIHKHLCDFLEKSGFPSDKLIHNLDE